MPAAAGGVGAAGAVGAAGGALPAAWLYAIGALTTQRANVIMATIGDARSVFVFVLMGADGNTVCQRVRTFGVSSLE